MKNTIKLNGCFLWAFVFTGISISVHAAEKPNIVLIYADDQGWNGTSVRMHPDRAGKALTGVHNTGTAPGYPVQPVPASDVTLAPDNFWSPRIETNRTVTVWHNFQQCEETGRLDNFAKAAGIKDGTYEGLRFNDSDVYKAIEGASYILADHPDPELETYLDELIDTIAGSQQPDGYIYTVMTVPHNPDKPVKGVGKERWIHGRHSHELYCMGHLQEAAVAHFEATGKRSFLDVAIKTADLMVDTFGPGKLEMPPGHQQVELGLTELYRITGETKYLDLAGFFLEQRGRKSDDRDKLWNSYFQDDLPVRRQREAVGHAVRAAYQYAAMADVAVLTDNAAYKDVLGALWENVVERKLYLTGGIGGGSGEGFSGEYDLPNMRAYNETCSSIANILWQQRMFQLEGDGKYIDILERCLFNSFLSGVSLEGDTFFYPNKLTSVNGHERSPWFPCACCPPNVLRFIPQIPGLQYAVARDKIWVNLYGSNSAEVVLDGVNVDVVQTSAYPWDGHVRLELYPDEKTQFAVAMRVPGWTKKPFPSDLYRYTDSVHSQVTLKVNGETVPVNVDGGYAAIDRSWEKSDVIELDMPMPVRTVVANEKVESCRGRVALVRGPLVYCAEGPDNNDNKVHSVLVPPNAQFTPEFRPNLLGGVTALKGNVKSFAWTEDGETAVSAHELKAVPYYAWAHRGRHPMRVWHARNAENVWPSPVASIAAESKIESSSRNPWSTMGALNDQIVPLSSADKEVPRFVWKKVSSTPDKGKTVRRWVQYEFPQFTAISSCGVYWAADGTDRIQLPDSYRLLYRQNNRWISATPKPLTAVADKVNRLTFDPITADAVRLEASFSPKTAGGILEWSVK